MSFHHTYQHNQMDCGPTCLYMVCRHYGRRFSIEKLRALTEIGKEGVNLLGISDAAEKVGLRTQALQLSLQELTDDIVLPAILHWSQNHFVVLYKVRKNWLQNFGGKRKTKFFIADTAHGLVTASQKELEQQWLSSYSDGTACGIALTLEPSPEFYNNQ